jgi:uncharacterized membrane protein
MRLPDRDGPYICRPTARGYSPQRSEIRAAEPVAPSRSVSERRPVMSTVKETVEVEVPVRTAYNQWTQFEEFPNFMEGVEEVTQLDDRHNHWTTKIGGVRREFDTEIVDQLPDERITWRTTTGDTRQKGSVRFQSVDETHTRVELVLDVEPTGVVEKAADMMGTIDRRIKGDMRRFKEYIEHRGSESGAWRGRITPG